MGTFLALLILLLVTFCLWGIGTSVQRIGHCKLARHTTAIGIGLATVIFVGGLLNLAHLAFAPALWTVAGVGLVIAAVEILRLKIRLPGGLSENAEALAAGALILVVTVFAIYTQLPPRAFNFHDDFQKYFAHPVRMLQTGTLAGSTLSALGAETLGAQAYLHGFVLSVLPIGYINGVDAIFGLFALMLVAAAAGKRRYLWFPGAVLGSLLVATINPQYVNISGLYIGGLLIATAVVLVLEERESAPPPYQLGLIYGALVAVKPTFALFAALHLPLAAVALRRTFDSAREDAKWALRTMVWSAVAVLPWVALYAPNYLAHGTLPRQAVPAGNDGSVNIFSPRPFLYGASFLNYTAIVMVVLILAGAGFYLLQKKADAQQTSGSYGLLAGGAAGVLSYFILVVGLGRALNGYETNLRYAMPFLLGTCVIFLVKAPSLAPAVPKWMSQHGALIASLVIFSSFIPSMRTRYKQAFDYGSILAFSRLAEHPDYLAYNKYCLSDGAQKYISALQSKVPEGETMVAWINTPFLLDYKRNKIIDADVMGISTPWARIPRNVRYVLWQYQGFGVRTRANYVEDMQGPGAHERNIAAQSLAFGNYMAQLVPASKVLASDSQFVVFELSQGDSPSSK
jgi:hypothetical protein